MLDKKKIALIGYGDVAQRCARRFPNDTLYAICRRQKTMPPNVQWWRGDVTHESVLEHIRQTPVDIAIITLTPSEFSEQGYQQGYVEPVKLLMDFWRKNLPPKLVIFVSSTGVYHQQNGEWVDENSATEPTGFSGKSLLQAESLLLGQSAYPCSVVRFGGIYGPGRDYLLRDVKAGNGGSAAYTNRIHAEDCAGVIAFLIDQWEKGEGPDPVYLACDNEPAPGNEVRAWVAAGLAIAPESLKPSRSARGGNKRCSNKKLREAGYHFEYPSYREGYSEMLSSESAKS